MIGGDIVSLSLPKYLKQIDVADDPFKLLENSLGRSYIAQSGLIGQNGIDNSGRAMYESRYESYRLEGGQDLLQVDLVNNVQPDITVTKRFTFRRSSYLIDIEFLVENNSDTTWVQMHLAKSSGIILMTPAVWAVLADFSWIRNNYSR